MNIVCMGMGHPFADVEKVDLREYDVVAEVESQCMGKSTAAPFSHVNLLTTATKRTYKGVS